MTFHSPGGKRGSFFTALPLWSWLVLFSLGGGIVGLGGFTFSYAEGLSYFSDDPKACSNCHVMRDVYDSWNRGAHHHVAGCNDCHTPHTSLVAKYVIKGLNGWNHSKAFTLNDFPATIRITPLNRAIAQENCVACHGELVSLIVHDDQAEGTDCLTCHTGVGHGK